LAVAGVEIPSPLHDARYTPLTRSISPPGQPSSSLLALTFHKTKRARLSRSISRTGRSQALLVKLLLTHLYANVLKFVLELQFKSQLYFISDRKIQ
jgi:hypothetical protein